MFMGWVPLRRLSFDLVQSQESSVNPSTPGMPRSILRCKIWAAFRTRLRAEPAAAADVPAALEVCCDAQQAECEDCTNASWRCVRWYTHCNHGNPAIPVGDLKGQQRDGSGARSPRRRPTRAQIRDEEHGLDGLVAQRHRPVGSLGRLQDRASPTAQGLDPTASGGIATLSLLRGGSCCVHAPFLSSAWAIDVPANVGTCCNLNA